MAHPNDIAKEAIALAETWQNRAVALMNSREKARHRRMAALFAMTTAPIRVYSQEIVAPAWRPVMSGAALMAVGLSTAAMSLGGGYAIAALGYRSIFLAGAGLTAVGALLFWAYFSTPCGELAHPPATGTDR